MNQQEDEIIENIMSRTVRITRLQYRDELIRSISENLGVGVWFGYELDRSRNIYCLLSTNVLYQMKDGGIRLSLLPDIIFYKVLESIKFLLPKENDIYAKLDNIINRPQESSCITDEMQELLWEALTIANRIFIYRTY